MSIELEDFDMSCDISGYLDWVLEAGIWDGRLVSWTKASEFRDEIQGRILRLLFENPDSPFFEQLAAQLSLLGTPALNQTLLARDIEELDFSKSDLILQVGLKKSLSKFWKKHKKEILIGAAIIAAVTVVVVVSVATAGVGAGAAVAAGGAALGGACDKDNQEKLSKDSSKISKPVLPPLELPDLSPISTQLSFGETGVVFNQQYTSYNNILLNRAEPTLPQTSYSSTFAPPPPSGLTGSTPIHRTLPYPQMHPDILTPRHPDSAPLIPNHLFERPFSPDTSPIDLTLSSELRPIVSQKKSWFADFLDTIGRGIIDSPDLLDPNIPLPSRELSSKFSTLGERISWLGLGAINGMNTKKEEAIAHANHLAKFAQGRCVDWVYNQSHGSVVDVLEILVFNLSGFSPNTCDLLSENWTAFADANTDNPDVKFLQFCHSQGTIHVRNALERAPKEIRDRVIVQAFGPAVIIPDELCFRVNHYACKGDVIPHGEVVYAGLMRGIMKGSQILENHEKLIWIDPHPNTKSPHDFQNPAFDSIKRDAIEDHLTRKGVYK